MKSSQIPSTSSSSSFRLPHRHLPSNPPSIPSLPQQPSSPANPPTAAAVTLQPTFNLFRSPPLLPSITTRPSQTHKTAHQPKPTHLTPSPPPRLHPPSSLPPQNFTLFTVNSPTNPQNHNLNIRRKPPRPSVRVSITFDSPPPAIPPLKPNPFALLLNHSFNNFNFCLI
ncbi:proline-rich receptor-like protein kinase PERK2 [Lathyrus oleraceus]|uniref:proline-rich receptor-like protein kinase PERK2 n=1 Tax=Pisum sativum TaxID=3888 RepID=UPI001FC55FFE|nr:proline-rich receptor-like protein kinase PERK2 [Pisum sativum]